MITLLSAPSNLGLRPPQQGSVPGTAKAPEALREAGLYERFRSAGADEDGVVLPGRYVDDAAPVPGRLRNQSAILTHGEALAARVARILDRGSSPVVLGGDCSILLGAALALRRRGRHALVHIDGHTDFRHPGNSPVCRSLAGEDLAAVTGSHWEAVSDVDGLGPYVLPSDAVHIGCRDDDEHLDEARSRLGAVVPVSVLRERGVPATAQAASAVVASPPIEGFWIHLDVDVLDPRYMPAVDSPDSGGITPDELVELLGRLAPAALGADVAAFDPELDADGGCAALLVEVLSVGLARLGSEREHR